MRDRFRAPSVWLHLTPITRIATENRHGGCRITPRADVGPVKPPKSPYAPTSRAEMEARGWDQCDIIFVSGDAYIDHPSFGVAIIVRVLEALSVTRLA